MLVEDMPDGKEARPDNVGSDLKSGSVIVVSANMELTLRNDVENRAHWSLGI